MVAKVQPSGAKTALLAITLLTIPARQMSPLIPTRVLAYEA